LVSRGEAKRQRGEREREREREREEEEAGCKESERKRWLFWGGQIRGNKI
jgi:hypothetical protein